MTNFIRMLMRNVIVNVFKSDALTWWAAIFRIEGPCGCGAITGLHGFVDCEDSARLVA